MNFKHQVITCAIIITALSLAIIAQLNFTSQQKTKPYVLCTTTIIADVARNIGKEIVDVVTLMGPGVDPHLYKPVESDVLKIASADIIFYNGLHLEAKMADLFEHLAKKQTTIAVTQDMPRSQLIAVDQYNQIFDPHVWFDINLWIYAIDTICKALITQFPEHAHNFTKNADIYHTQLKQLLAHTQLIMRSIPKNNRVLISGHDAFSYFGRLYDCTVIGLQGISTESSPGAYDIAKIVRLICDQNIPAIFIESSIPIKNITAIQQGVAACGKQVACGGQLYSDALGGQNSSGNSYVTMLLHNVQTIASALQSKK